MLLFKDQRAELRVGSVGGHRAVGVLPPAHRGTTAFMPVASLWRRNNCSSTSSSSEDEGSDEPGARLSSIDSGVLAERIETHAARHLLGTGDFVAVLAGENAEQDLFWPMRVDGPPRPTTASEAAEWHAAVSGGSEATYEVGPLIVMGRWLEYSDKPCYSYSARRFSCHCPAGFEGG